MKNSRIFYLKTFSFLVVKFSIYLNRRVFVMSYAEVFHLSTAYVSEQHGFWRDCADAQARLNVCCLLQRLFFPKGLRYYFSLFSFLLRLWSGL